MVFDERSLSSNNRNLLLNRSKFIEALDALLRIQKMEELRVKLRDLRGCLISTQGDPFGLLDASENGDFVDLGYEYLIGEFLQIEKSQTLERARYYIERLKKSLTEVKTSKINDINMNRWKEYEEIITDSLWLFDHRDTSGAHLGWYWGNFIPQIPRQMMLRFTRKGEWVLDTFVGSGTTLIECRRLGRNGIGIELNPEVAERAKGLIEREENRDGVKSDLIVGDSRKVDMGEILKGYGIKQVQLLIMHPPYHDIIRFSTDERDLSNANDIKGFLKMFGEVVDNATPFLEEGRYFALVIGDKYAKGEWIPLGFSCMNEVLKRGYTLKSIIVKNFEETRGKRNQQELWRYRALVGGFYVFKHEYILLFRKS
jgi:hypothetical protein